MRRSRASAHSPLLTPSWAHKLKSSDAFSAPTKVPCRNPRKIDGASHAKQRKINALPLLRAECWPSFRRTGESPNPRHPFGGAALHALPDRQCERGRNFGAKGGRAVYKAKAAAKRCVVAASWSAIAGASYSARLAGYLIFSGGTQRACSSPLRGSQRYSGPP